MKVIRIIAFVLLGFLLLFFGGTWWYYGSRSLPSEPVNASIVPRDRIAGLAWIPIVWAADTLSDRTAMFLPIYVDTIAKPFLAQFDLGTPITDFEDLGRYFPAMKERERMIGTPVRYQTRPVSFSGFDVRIGRGAVYTARHIPLYDQVEMDSLRENDSMYDTRVGSLGYDLVAGRILVMDFHDSRIALTDSLPPEVDEMVEWAEGAVVNQFPMYLPISIDGHRRLMKYDNGSSAFTMLAEFADWNRWRRSDAVVDTLPFSAWGREGLALRAPAGVAVSLLGRDVSALPIWTSTLDASETGGSLLRSIQRFTDTYFAATFAGWLGNEYFRDDVLVFDTRRNRFGRMVHGTP